LESFFASNPNCHPSCYEQDHVPEHHLNLVLRFILERSPSHDYQPVNLIHSTLHNEKTKNDQASSILDRKVDLIKTNWTTLSDMVVDSILDYLQVLLGKGPEFLKEIAYFKNMSADEINAHFYQLLCSYRDVTKMSINLFYNEAISYADHSFLFMTKMEIDSFNIKIRKSIKSLCSKCADQKYTVNKAKLYSRRLYKYFHLLTKTVVDFLQLSQSVEARRSVMYHYDEIRASMVSLFHQGLHNRQLVHNLINSSDPIVQNELIDLQQTVEELNKNLYTLDINPALRRCVVLPSDMVGEEYELNISTKRQRNTCMIEIENICKATI
jgi:hypothetical protein